MTDPSRLKSKSVGREPRAGLPRWLIVVVLSVLALLLLVIIAMLATGGGSRHVRPDHGGGTAELPTGGAPGHVPPSGAHGN